MGGWYFLVGYLLILANCARFVALGRPVDAASAAFAVAAYLSYAMLYLLPVMALAHLAWWLGHGRWRWVGDLVAVAGLSLIQLLLVVDHEVYRLFGFHLDGFVWNLVTTRGGLESLGGGPDVTRVALALALGIVALHAALLGAIARRAAMRGALPAPFTPRRLALAAAVLAGAALGERVVYGVSELNGRTPVLAVADAVPGYLPLHLTPLAAAAGIAPAGRVSVEPARPAPLAYPAAPLRARPPEPAYNVVVLVAESLRADMLHPDVMPELWAFSRGATRFTDHYSGGNGTRMAMFSMFYGLYGNYWLPMLDARRSPVLMDRVQALDYQLLLQTSATFTYPEFDLTMFARVPREQLYEEARGKYGWQHDRLNVDRMIAWLRDRDPARPFFAFQFFESPHAAYFFPEDAVIRRPYLEALNYAAIDLSRDMGLIKNRYVNAVHHLDQQLGRVFAALAEQRLLDRTIVVVTGDHGEEFMEKGRWGHNSQFSEEQLRVPFVLFVPGRRGAEVGRLTSHLDVAPTLLPFLGVDSPASDYALGESLLTGRSRAYTVVSDWNSVAYVDGRYKLVFPLRLGHPAKRPVTDAADRPVEAVDAVRAEYREALMQMLRDMRRFRGGTSTHAASDRSGRAG